MNKKAIVINPVNILIAFIAIVGAGAFLINQPNYGLILLIISTLVEAITRIIR